jgi:lysophospholipase L1-like esterase
MRATIAPVQERYLRVAVFVVLAASFAIFLRTGTQPALAQNATERDGWEPAIRTFEEQDKVNPPKPGCIVFAGSSSFRYWDTLLSEMKPLDVVNRGFGGSEMADLNFYAKRIVIAYKPSAVVVYEGDNDLADGSKSPQMVADDFRKFIQIVHTALPETWIYILSIKPSKARWDQWPAMQMTNTLIQNYALAQQRTQFIDVATPMFDAKGGLPGDLFKFDGLHPSAKLYAMWTSIIKPILMERFSPRPKKTAQLDFSVLSVPSVASAFAILQPN